MAVSGTMELLGHTEHIHPTLLQNGYINRVFNPSFKSGKGEPMKVSELDHCDSNPQGVSKEIYYEKKTKGSRLWKFFSRRSTNTVGYNRRPQSMILTGDYSKPSKLSFSDRLRAFKKLRSTPFFRNQSIRTSKSKITNVLKDDKGNSRRSVDNTIRKVIEHKPFRHSYAGYSKDFDCSFDDLELTTISETDAKENQCIGGITNRVNDPNSDEDVPEFYNGERHFSNFSNCNNSTFLEVAVQRECPKSPQESRRKKTSAMWNYFRGRKDNSKLLDQSIDSEVQSSENTFDSVPDGNCKQSDKGSHFNGVFRFFSSMAEAARRWRSPPRTFSQTEQASQATPETSRHEVSSQKVSFILENEGRRATSVVLPAKSPDSGVCDHLSPATSPEAVSSESTTVDISELRHAFAVSFSTNKNGCSSDMPVTAEKPHSLSNEYNTLESGIQEDHNPESSIQDLNGNVCSKRIICECLELALGRTCTIENQTGFKKGPCASLVSLQRQKETGYQNDDTKDSGLSDHSQASLCTAISKCKEEKDKGLQRLDSEKENDGLQDSCSRGPLPKWRKKRPSSAYCQLSTIQYPILEETESQKRDEEHFRKTVAQAEEYSPPKISKIHPRKAIVRQRPFSVIDRVALDKTEDLHPCRLLSRPPPPCSEAPPYKGQLDRSHSFPFSLSTPTGLDQVGWKKQTLLRTDLSDMMDKWKPEYPCEIYQNYGECHNPFKHLLTGQCTPKGGVQRKAKTKFSTLSSACYKGKIGQVYYG
ncbi:uncharacterized protein LOC135360136 [Latimeria chalumnae]|uniref:uncharacterized protein LOC135360136 n=1 Tax=Latimeria chalumnae TaxID=7897 RepID=UPI00313C4429